MRRQSLVHLLAFLAVFMVALNMYTFYSLYRGQLWKPMDAQKLHNGSVTSFLADSDFLEWKEQHTICSPKVFSLRFVVSH